MARRFATVLAIVAATLATPVACTSTPAETAADTATPADHGLSAAQRDRLDRLVSLFENGTQEIDYAYAEDLDDGRGITAGRAGFTSATGDLVVVVERYVAEVPDAPLAAHLPELRRLADDEDDDTTGLAGFVDDWAAAADDPVMREVQDAFVDEEYVEPALDRADAAGLRLPLSRAVLVDTNIQHGSGDDPDGLPALIAETTEDAGGDPASGVDEEEWLWTFLAVRRAHLEDAADPATREEWAESVSRIDVWEQVLEDGHLELDGPIEVRTGDYDETIP